MDEQFEEFVKGDDGKIGNWLTVTADDYFVSVITDPYEGHAMFDVSVAKKLLEVLPRAIKHVEGAKAQKPGEQKA